MIKNNFIWNFDFSKLLIANSAIWNWWLYFGEYSI